MKKKNKIVEILFIMAVAFILIISDRGKVYAADAVVSFGKDSYSVNMDDTFEMEILVFIKLNFNMIQDAWSMYQELRQKKMA